MSGKYLQKKYTFFCACLITISSFVLQTGCNTAEKVPDVSNIKVDLHIYRFDLDLYAIDTNHVGEGLRRLQEKYPDFLSYYLDTIHEYKIHGNFSDTVDGIRNGVRIDLTFKDFVHLEDTIKLFYPTVKDIDAQLLRGFQFVKYYFPNFYVPRIIYLNMGLSKWPTFPRDTTTFCIGLDMFLGDSFPYHAYIGLPDYTASHRRKSYLPVSLFSTIYKTYHPFNPDDKTLLDLMIDRGKEFYFLHKILPGTPDSVLFGFTSLQLGWCEKNENLIYNFFTRGNMLFSREMLAVMPYVSDGPFAKGIEDPSDSVKYSPGNIGSWLGYRMVSQWMQQNPKVSLSSLVNDNIPSTRFTDNYRPK